MSEIALFVSHSAADAELAKLLVYATEKALALPARAIRCSSVDGYRLPAGSDFDEQLREEIFGSRAFVALFTPRSLDSTYVLFEVGARWGARKRVFPLVACGALPAALDGPLAGLNTLTASSTDHLFQFLQELSEVLEVPLQPIGSFSDAVRAVATEAAKERSSHDAGSGPPVVAADLTDDEIVALLQDWMGRRTVRENTAPIYYADVEKQTGIRKARLAKLLEVAANRYNYIIDRKGESLILFKQLPNRLRAS